MAILTLHIPIQRGFVSDVLMFLMTHYNTVCCCLFPVFPQVPPRDYVNFKFNLRMCSLYYILLA